MPEPTEAEGLLNRAKSKVAQRFLNETDIPADEFLFLIDALVAAAKRVGAEARDREWLDAVDGQILASDGRNLLQYSPDILVQDVAMRMGYEPDGSGGWRKIGAEDGE